MKCVETYATAEMAREKQHLLQAYGIDVRMVVDPLESMAPALSPMIGVGLMVPEARHAEALKLLRLPHKKAS